MFRFMSGTHVLASLFATIGLAVGLPLSAVAQTSTTADLRVDKTAVTSVTQLGRVDFQIEVFNPGPETAYSVLISDVPPPGGQPADQATILFSDGGTTAPAGATATAFPVGDLQPGTSVSLLLPYLYETSGTLINTAVARFDGIDPDQTNNFSSVPFLVLNPTTTDTADLQITKTGPAQPVSSDENITYTITVVNDGPSSATNVLVRDPIPTGTELTTASTSQGAAVFNPAGYLDVLVGTLAPDTTATIVLDLMTTQPGQVVNVASVTADQPSSALVEDNSAVAITDVNPPPGPTCPTYATVFEGPAVAKCKTSKQNETRCRVRAELTVTNVGNTTAEKTKIAYYLSPDPVYDPTDLALKIQSLKKLKPGQTASKKVNAKIPVDVNPTGQFLIARVQCVEGGHSEDSTPIVEEQQQSR
jgi:uncharacterized repeat protein (TIGR01451 family)